MGDRNTSTWAITCCLSRVALAESWIGSEVAKTQTRHSNMGWGHPKQHINLCSKAWPRALWEIAILSSRVTDYTIFAFIPAAMIKSSCYSLSLPAFAISSVSDFIHVSGCKVISQCFNPSFLMTCDASTFSYAYLPSVHSLWWGACWHILPSFKLHFLIFESFKKSLYILEIFNFFPLKLLTDIKFSPRIQAHAETNAGMLVVSELGTKK